MTPDSDVPSQPFDPEQDGWTRRETNPFFEAFEPQWIKGRGGDYAAALVCPPTMLNGYGIMHGGALAAAWDQFLGSAVADVVLVGTDQHAVTIQLNINFMAAIRRGEFIVARFRVPRQTRSLIFIEGTMLVGDEIVSTAQSLFKIMKSQG
ncbi:PaaI family thioesterase [Devosia sp. A369]